MMECFGLISIVSLWIPCCCWFRCWLFCVPMHVAVLIFLLFNGIFLHPTPLPRRLTTAIRGCVRYEKWLMAVIICCADFY